MHFAVTTKNSLDGKTIDFVPVSLQTLDYFHFEERSVNFIDSHDFDHGFWLTFSISVADYDTLETSTKTFEYQNLSPYPTKSYFTFKFTQFCINNNIDDRSYFCLLNIRYTPPEDAPITI